MRAIHVCCVWVSFKVQNLGREITQMIRITLLIYWTYIDIQPHWWRHKIFRIRTITCDVLARFFFSIRYFICLKCHICVTCSLQYPTGNRLYIVESEIKCSDQEESIETLISDNRRHHLGPGSAKLCIQPSIRRKIMTHLLTGQSLQFCVISDTCRDIRYWL
jgi:hypothetical protein